LRIWKRTLTPISASRTWIGTDVPTRQRKSVAHKMVMLQSVSLLR
jgi:hypothetical protein